jgi:hypothetical protein
MMLVLLFFLRWSDSAKFYLIKGHAFWLSIIHGFKAIFHQFLNAFLHYIAISGLFVLSVIAYISIDSTLFATDGTMLLLIIIFQQIVVFAKQFTRFIIFGMALDAAPKKESKATKNIELDLLTSETV